MSEINENEIIEENIEDNSDKKENESLEEKNNNENNEDKNKINENNITNVNKVDNNNNSNDYKNEKDDSNSELINLLYSEKKSKENKRRNLSQETKRNKDNNININMIKDKRKKIKKNIKNLEDDKDYKQLKEDIDKGTNFIDYFLIIGVEPQDFFNDKIYECDLDELKNKYGDKLQPKIISYFPKFEKKTIAFDDSIISHCFPNGFNIIKSNKIPKPEIFSFILDNNYFNLNYPQKYLSCLICY
jgi:hypothetical protein